MKKIKEIFKKIAKCPKEIFESFKKADLITKISFFIIGLKHIALKQRIKGISYLLLEIIFIVYMLFMGGEQLVGFFTLGDKPFNVAMGGKGDHSTFMLIYGIFSIIIILVYLTIHINSVKDAINLNIMQNDGKKINSDKDFIKSLANKNFYKLALAIPILGALLFTIIPLIFMICIAFTDFGAPNNLPPAQLFNWVGLDSFFKLWRLKAFSGTIGKILIWNISYAIVSAVVYYIVALALAVLFMDKKLKGSKIFRTCIMLSYAVPSFITLLGLRYFVSSIGPLNNFLVNVLGFDKPVDFLIGKWPARFTAFVVGGWLAIPATMFYMSGILTTIPEEVKEAAIIDGASKFQIFKKITLPYVLFATTPVVITSFMGQFNNFGLFFFFAGNRPTSDGYFLANDTDLLINWLYKLSLDNSYYSIAACVGLIIFVIMATISLLTYTRTKSYKSEDEFR